MERKKVILIMVFVSVFSVGLLLFLTRPGTDKENADKTIGTFTYTKPEEPQEDLTDQYEPSKEPGSELDPNNVDIVNYELLYDILPVNAVGSISIHTAEFLNEHGYGGYHELTILKDTISSDKTYPRFLCSLDDTEKYLEIRYRVDTKEFTFAILDTVY